MGNKQTERFCPFTCCLHFFCCYFSLAPLLPHAKQEIQDGHNGYHSEAEPDQVASFTHLSFINCVARYYKLVLILCIQILHFSRKRSPRKHLVCNWLCARQSFLVRSCSVKCNTEHKPHLTEHIHP